MKEIPKIETTKTDKILEIIGLISVIGLWCMIIINYTKLPEIIPIHYNGMGEPDGFGKKSEVFVLPIIATIMFIGLTKLNKYPHIFNYPTKITKENAVKQYTNTTRMIRFLKLVIVFVFGLIAFQTIRYANGHTDGLGEWFLPTTMGLVFIPLIYFIAKSFKRNNMNKTTLVIFFLLINISNLFSQESIIRSYEIHGFEKPQKVVLFEYTNGKYGGNIITELRKGKVRDGWLSRTWKNIWAKNTKEVIDVNPINELVVNKLMTELKENDIETIKSCSDDKECESNSHFLHAGTIYFSIKTIEIQREYMFHGIVPLNENYKEETYLRSKAQNLVTILYEQLDLNQRFWQVFERLPRRYYFWGEQHVLVNYKKKKL